MNNPRYSICITHYEMEETIIPSLESILHQIDDRFEVIVVDAGSTDGSLEYLRKKENNGEIRLVVSRGCSRGEGRNLAVEQAEGSVLLHQMDMDDYYYPRVIEDFAEIYELLSSKLDKKFYLSGQNINAVSKDFFFEIGGYRDLRIEDNDLWRRFISKDALINLKHDDICQQLGCGKKLSGKLKRSFWEKYSELKSGVTGRSMAKWHLSKSKKIDGNSWKLLPWNILSILFAYALLKFRNEKTYSAPRGLQDYSRYRDNMSNKVLSEIEKFNDVDLGSLEENFYASQQS